MFTLETSRGGSGVLAAYANLQLFGYVGLRVLLGHLVEMAETLREHLEGHDCTTVLNDDGVGMVTVFRVYPDGVDTWTVRDRERTDPAARDELLRTTTTTAGCSGIYTSGRCAAKAFASP